ncbi:MAG TPA: dihydrofolate reductase family protein [Acidobacteriota bacterium]|nr:dihydrofolate reductase family protein [Acidobacteriota bacterium]
MRTVKYFVAMSLDAYLADPEGGVDWLFGDQDYGMTEFYSTVDTVLLGRKTYEFGLSHGMRKYKGMDNYVFSSTLDPQDYPEVTVTSEHPAQAVGRLKEEDGKAIWLVGGGQLAQPLFRAGLIDEVSVAVHPILLGRGIPLLPDSDRHIRLHLQDITRYDTGLVTLSYSVTRR